MKITFLLILSFLVLTSCFSSNNNQVNLNSFQDNLPAALSIPKYLVKKFVKKRERLGLNYHPRTKHLNKKGWAKFTNRLFLETSPYLMQHAHNPVNWYPWGEEAFSTAKKQKKLILLSIGYSTCHWCHIMEEESFEDLEIAKNMNKNYISIKIDREERPDVDAVYMAVVQAISGSGGWPMTLWLTPDKKPIYGSTYIPARDGDRGVKVGFLTMLKYFTNLHKTQPEKIMKNSVALTRIVRKNLEQTHIGKIPTASTIDKAVDVYLNRYDNINGGLIGHPKFPSSLPISLMLRKYNQLKSDSSSNSSVKSKNILKMITTTLFKMTNGGMYDHVAGGIHRYSTDQFWLVPHFEKMLYDNALISINLTKTYQATKNEKFKTISSEILDYILRDMTTADGVFYSSSDADSIGPLGLREEGYYYTWTPEELLKLLNKKESSFIQDYYNVTKEGNFENKRSILNISNNLNVVAKKHHLTKQQANNLLNSINKKLYQQRKQRPAPLIDTKVLTSWNGLMISALAKASFAFHKPVYLRAAKKAASFFLKKMIKKNHLFRTYNDHQAKLAGYLDDYAFFIAGLIDLYQVSGELKWITQAIHLDNILMKNFEDKIHGGYFMTGNNHEKLIAREKPSYDGAQPSGNSIQALNLLKLHLLTTNDQYRKRAVKTFQSFSQILKKAPQSLAQMLLALDFYYTENKEVILSIPPNKKKTETNKLISYFRTRYSPNIVYCLVNKQNIKEQKSIPIINQKIPINSKVTAYVCKKGSCQLPTTNLKSFKKLLN